MTVEIIGEAPEAKRKAVCRDCAAMLTYTRSDVFVHRYSACGHSEADDAIRCPRCSSVIFVSSAGT